MLLTINERKKGVKYCVLNKTKPLTIRKIVSSLFHSSSQAEQAFHFCLQQQQRKQKIPYHIIKQALRACSFGIHQFTMSKTCSLASIDQFNQSRRSLKQSVDKTMQSISQSKQSIAWMMLSINETKQSISLVTAYQLL